MPKKEPEIEIIHVMADGTELDSIEGVVIKVNEKTKLFYQTLANIVLSGLQPTKKQNGGGKDDNF